LASYDEETWFRVPTRYDGSHLIWQHTPTGNSISYAFFVPYLESQREKLLQEATKHVHVNLRSLGKTPQGRNIDLLVFGDESRADSQTIWVVSRQHAGEPMAEYATEGFIRQLLETSNEATQQLLDQATIYVVPNMNPDGSANGNLRANANGVDLNRVWHEPNDESIEVKVVVDAIAETGCDYFIDMHGDETRPFIWLIGPGEKMTLEQKAIHQQFEDFLATKHPEVLPAPESIVREAVAPGMSNNFIFRTYQCPGWIVELPFCETPEGDTLLAEGCMSFGRSCVEALVYVMRE
jgi:murein tripeptide amidase MpaA